MDMEFDLYDTHRHALYDPLFSVYQVTISDIDFKIFHTYDRKLFHRLIRKLGRNVDESVRVVAFLIWLERSRYGHNAVINVSAWPFHLVDKVANEIAAFLLCLESNQSPDYTDLYLLPTLCSRPINVFRFHEKRIKIIEGVNKVIDEVCLRAFDDIVTGDGEFVDEEDDRMWHAYNNPGFHPNVSSGFRQQGYERNLGFPQYLGLGRDFGLENFMSAGYQNQSRSEDTNDLSEHLGGLNLVNDFEHDVPPDDRTIFLTFSKGYYVPELEIQEFFTRRFGDFIDGLYMQDVSSDEQPLFARMVCRSSAIIPAIAPPGRKTKYSINGKHVWAKKYVKKNGSSTVTAS